MQGNHPTHVELVIINDGGGFLLVALTRNGEKIALYKRWEKEHLLRLKKAQGFFCPCCNCSVDIKLGKQRMWHFAHQRGHVCSVETEAESDYHMNGKLLLFQWLQQFCKEVFLEHYLPTIQQRPDIFFLLGGEKYAIEYQCSTMDEELFLKRSKAYTGANITPIWVLGGNRFKRKSETAISFTSFDWLCIRSNYLLFFCPNTKSFVKASTLIKFSPRYTFSHLRFLSMKDAGLSIFHKDSHSLAFSDAFISEWLHKKKGWRMQAHFQHTYLTKTLYLRNIHISLIPGEAGIPLHKLYLLETPAIIWQAYLLCIILSPLLKDEKITIDQVVASISSHHLFQVKEFPLNYKYTLKDVIEEYFQALTGLAILRLKGNQYQKVSDIYLPKNLEEALQQDKLVLNRLRRSRK